MKCFITFNLLGRKNNFIFLLLMTLNLFYEYNLKNNEQIIYYNYYYPIFTFFKYLGFIFFTYFLYLIERKNFSIKNIPLKELSSKQKFISLDIDFKIFIPENFFFIFFISLIDFLDGNFFLFRMKTGGQICEIITFYLFIFIYSQNIYRHHVLGLFITLISGIIDIIFCIIKYKNNIIKYSNSFIFNILVSLHYLFEKYLIEKKYCSKFLLLFYKGIFGIIFTIISQFIYYFYNKNMLFKYSIISNHKSCFLYFFFSIFFIELCIIILINKTKNIIFLLIIFFSKYISRNFFRVICNCDIFNKGILIIINSIFNILGALIFMEILILNFLKFNVNVNKEISKRAITDINFIL